MKRRAFAITAIALMLAIICVATAATLPNVEAAPMQQVYPGVPVACWDLEEASGTRFDVFAGGNADLTDTNTVLSDTGIVGTAADFEASNSESLTHSDNATLSTGDIDYSIVAWVKLESGGAYQTIAAKRTVNIEYIFSITPANKLEFAAFNGVTSGIGNVVSTTALTTGTWYFVAGWHDAANNQVGVQINNGTPATGSTSGAAGDSDATFRLGVNNGGAEWLDGLLDSVVFDKQVFSSGELLWFYNSGAGRACADLNPATATPTSTSTNTPTNTPTATDTSTPTVTYTPTATYTPSATPTATSTATPTNTPTNTPTATPISFDEIGTFAATGDGYTIQYHVDFGDILIASFLVPPSLLLGAIVWILARPRLRRRHDSNP